MRLLLELSSRYTIEFDCERVEQANQCPGETDRMHLFLIQIAAILLVTLSLGTLARRLVQARVIG